MEAAADAGGQPVGAALDTLTGRARSASEQTAYDKWLDQTSYREEARRPHPVRSASSRAPLWVVLFFISGVIFVFMSSSPTAPSGRGRRRC